MVNLFFTTSIEKVKSGETKQAIRPVRKREYRLGMPIKCLKGTRWMKGKKELLYEGRITEIKKLSWNSIRQNKQIISADDTSSPDEFRKWFREHYKNELEHMAFWVIRWT